MLPSWNMGGVIPPIRPEAAGHDPDRSPYRVDLPDFVSQFALSDRRAEILSGLLNYRQALHDCGLVAGFQWLDGSFLENVEDLEDREPNDIDVVTFFELPEGQTQQTLSAVVGHLFDSEETKNNFRVDAYPFVLNKPMSGNTVRMTAYWYSMWSHRRDGTWKGFAQVDLSPAQDQPSRDLLAELVAGGFEA